MIKIKTIIFDFGDVLVGDRSKDPHFLSLLHKLPKYQQRLCRSTSHKSEVGKVPYSEMIKMDKKYFFPKKSTEEIKTYFLKTKVLPCWKLAHRLVKNYQILVFSNHHRGAPEESGKLLNINVKDFPFVNSALVGMKKPQKQFYRYLLKHFNLNPKECIFVDDKERNLIPARNLGINTFLYNHNYSELVKFLREQHINF
jgi:putative hydrolase of the HAD superfamily